MISPLSRDQATAMVASAVRERDTIQSNLLELDASSGRRLLAGATLTGGSKARWDVAAAELAALWETFGACSAPVDQAAQLSASRRPNTFQLLEISGLLTGPSVRLSRPAAAPVRRDLTGGGETMVTITAAVREMRRSYAAATAAIGAAEADLATLRETLNHDPLALYARGRPDLARVGRLTQRVAAVTQRAGQLAALRADSARRIAAVTAVVTGARQAWQDAMVARKQAAAKIAAAALPAPPDVSGLAGRLAGLDVLAAQGRWTRLDAELDQLSRQATALAGGCRDAERQAVGLLERRDELRGLLDAYRARAAKLGGAEDAGLDERYDRAHGLLWAAPCDLPAAADAVTAAPGPSSAPATAVAAPAPVWTAVVTADRAYFDSVVANGGPDAADIEFPGYCPERRFRLAGSQMQVGRRSVSRGLEPEIDLTGPPADPGVSHLHAVLTAEPDGTWAVLDPGSSNGTIVNGGEVVPGVRVPLRDGDRICVGAWTVLTIQVHRT